MLNTDQYWALPDGISEALPDEAECLEQLRRSLLDLFSTWGYRLVMPPLVEFMESLSTGHGTHLDVQTFKLTDQLSGRMMGVRADMTPQIARIDAHKLKTAQTNRLCYIGSVLRTRSFHRDGSRSPLQVGAELFGHAGLDSDFEVISLLLATLNHCQVPDLLLDIGHVGIFRSLARAAGLNAQQERALYDILERKSLPEMDEWLQSAKLPDSIKRCLRQLPRLNGSVAVLDEAAGLFGDAFPEIQEALAYLHTLVGRVAASFPSCRIHVDLSELSGYDYHTGIVYGVYTPNMGREVARGGRYDGIGEAFGRGRQATGFSTDLRTLAKFSLPSMQLPTETAIFAPALQDAALEQLIHRLRNQGQRVIRALDGQTATPASLGCKRQITLQDGQWSVVAV
ncbi:ATP phosphoribosyltransferase regulatory subunit [Candidatus Thiothrix sp. Deng01]|uniref:ATP phosphoribosyltransferase regulatory subunit n=1 Tax=Candidatus Thiothrix phosphatis TaxID=3112415 RepID=A0ABU6CT62_9GAMM|nr:ATP phosphoribosyltransferase regulatory subunit [Candidatus Thiothrix sp. Deng01]MEB4589949.1 ATP phosphoribosyltransferase regulatory subunit [Candidatus Thiothrix sp. Deng01]